MSQYASWRILCANGHLNFVLKTDKDEHGKSFVGETIEQYKGKCMYCDGQLHGEESDGSEFDRWASREDGMHV